MSHPQFDQFVEHHRDSNLPAYLFMLQSLRQRLEEIAIRWKHRHALRKVHVIEALELPKDLKLAAVNRVMRNLEHALDRYTRD